MNTDKRGGRPPRKPAVRRSATTGGKRPFVRKRPAPGPDDGPVDITDPNQRIPRPARPKTADKRRADRKPERSEKEERRPDSRRPRAAGTRPARDTDETRPRRSFQKSDTDRTARSRDERAPSGRRPARSQEHDERRDTRRTDDEPKSNRRPPRPYDDRKKTAARTGKPGNEHPFRKSGDKREAKPRTKELDGLPAREAAVILLLEVLGNDRALDEVLLDAAKVPQLARLSRADRGFARAIAATSLRRLGQIDDALSQFLEKGLPQNSGPLHGILLVAGAQLLFLDSPAHAVINLSVQQVKQNRQSRHFDKLANAVLRRLSEKREEIIAAQDAARLNTPGWLWNSWVRAYGKDVATQICEAHLTQAALDLSVKTDTASWAEKIGGTLLPTGSIRLKHKGRIENIPGFEEGAWWVQDAAAALPAKLLGDIKGKRVADLAAAPGGKTAQLAAAGAEVTAVDWSAGRLGRLLDNLERLQLEADVVKADVLEWKPDQKFDAVLLDAPCTATGTIRRHPDLPQLKKPADIPELAKIQETMLDKALTFLKPGGTLVYCTCSLQQEEGPDQIKALLKRNSKVTLDPIKPEDFNGRPEWITPEGTLRTLPFHAPADDMEPGMDGFFAARLKLKK